ncbi:MAG: 2-oxo acid dehydrogenase subunit E2 [Anaerolineales bacterium]|nr:2-oxo acid dehydrogenase subunit E2 [Anaerolineales bacterium]
MPEEFFIPQLGQTVEEVTLVGWLVKDGEKISQGQAVMEVETDKAVFPVEANAKGYIHLGPYKEGDVLPVLTVVAVIGKQEDKFEVKGDTPTVEEAGPAPAANVTAEPALASAPKSESAESVFVSPRARKLAAETSVDVSRVTPTGYEGIRVTERDVRSYLSQQPKVTPVAQRMAADVGVDLRDVTGSGPGGRIVKQDVARAVQPLPIADVLERVPLKGVRGIIAERMAASVHTTARVTLVMEVDATELVAARTRLKDRVEQTWGFAPGYNDLLAKICATSLRKFPYMNARLAPDAVELLSHVNIGLAVDTERGLMVPVVQDVDKKNLHQFGTEFRELVERARKGRSLPDDLSGGTFTITNLGIYDVDAFTPVINLPEAAILGVGRIAPKVVPRGTEIVVRQLWTLSLVFDHRLVDGAPAARFLQHIKQLIEEPYLLLAE